MTTHDKVGDLMRKAAVKQAVGLRLLAAVERIAAYQRREEWALEVEMHGKHWTAHCGTGTARAATAAESIVKLADELEEA